MKNLPNKEDMTNLPKGPADHAMEGKSAEEKQGWTYNYGLNYLHAVISAPGGEIRSAV